MLDGERSYVRSESPQKI